jgi:Electron transfer DM13
MVVKPAPGTRASGARREGRGASSVRTPLAVRIAAVPATIALLIFGLWLFGAVIAPGYWAAIAFSVAWFVVLSVVLGKLTKGRRDLKRVVRATFWAASAASIFLFWWTSVRETTVDEKVATGVPARQLARSGGAEAGGVRDATPKRPATRTNVQTHQGTVTSLAHSARGRAAIVRLASGGRRLTLRDFDIDPGPQVEVRLVAGAEPDGSDFKRLGGLKGTRGNQQYAVDRGIDLGRYGTVVFWCVPFTQALAQARLAPS